MTRHLDDYCDISTKTLGFQESQVILSLILPVTGSGLLLN